MAPEARLFHFADLRFPVGDHSTHHFPADPSAIACVDLSGRRVSVRLVDDCYFGCGREPSTWNWLTSSFLEADCRRSGDDVAFTNLLVPLRFRSPICHGQPSAWRHALSTGTCFFSLGDCFAAPFFKRWPRSAN